MTTQRDTYLQEIQAIRGEMDRLLDGIDYCFDWKSGEEEWSGREVMYHMLDTPAGGIHSVLRGMLGGSIQEFSIIADLTNLTPERQERDIPGVREDTEAVLTDLEQLLSSATDAQIAGAMATAHLVSRGETIERTGQELVEGIFIRHWRQHLAQLAQIRESLGLD